MAFDSHDTNAAVLVIIFMESMEIMARDYDRKCVENVIRSVVILRPYGLPHTNAFFIRRDAFHVSRCNSHNVTCYVILAFHNYHRTISGCKQYSLLVQIKCAEKISIIF